MVFFSCFRSEPAGAQLASRPDACLKSIRVPSGRLAKVYVVPEDTVRSIRLRIETHFEEPLPMIVHHDRYMNQTEERAFLRYRHLETWKRVPESSTMHDFIHKELSYSPISDMEEAWRTSHPGHASF